MIKVLELPLEQDLGPLYQYLRANGVPVRIIEASGVQEVWVPDERLGAMTVELINRYQTDPSLREGLSQRQAQQAEFAGAPSGPQWSDWLVSFWQVPVTWLGLLGIALVAVLMMFESTLPLVYGLMFADPYLSDYATFSERVLILQQTMAEGQWWRLLTPAFIHLSTLHLLFNSLWFWYLGMRIERLQGSSHILLLILVSAIGSNLAQYLTTGPGFGGMSGVIYAYFGYAGWYSLRHPGHPLSLSPALLLFALVWLLIGFADLPILPDGGKFANMAHLGGLLLGILFAALSDQRRVPSADR